MVDIDDEKLVMARQLGASATINSKFELVGLAFDGMLETIISDYKYIPEARSISVDSRYLLWTLEKFENADNIINELTIVN